jgi:hypothetical protein
MSDFTRVQEQGLEQLKKQSKINDLVFVGAQVDQIAATGAKIFKVGAVAAADPTGQLFTAVVDERGLPVDLKGVDARTIFGGPRRPWRQYSYAVKFVCGVQEAADGCCCGPVRPGAYATEINIFNHQYSWAYVSKSVIPVVRGGLPLGREPRSVNAQGFDWIALAPGTATMDDCCRIEHLLFDAQPVVKPSLTIGFLEIVSDVELRVTAVYTATDLESRSVSIEVEEVAPKVKYPYYWWWNEIPATAISPATPAPATQGNASQQ